MTDPDRNTSASSQQSVSVALTSDSDGDGITVVLLETGVNTGVFSDDDATFTAGPSDDDADELAVAVTDQVTLTYAEPLFAGGTAARTDTAVIEDATGPAVSITSPAASARVRATVPVDVSASDDVGVTEVEVFVDGVSIGTDTTEPYGASWNTTTAANGSHVLSATAEDAAGNSTASPDVLVTVDNAAPTASFIVPTALTDSVTMSFNENVKSVSTSNTVLRVTGSSSNLAMKSLVCRNASNAVVSCSTGTVRKAILTPTAALTPGQSYTALVNPSGASAKVTDTAGNPVATNAKKDFRASRTEQENSAAARYRWGGVSASSASGGSYVADHFAGATASYTFTGTSITWYTVTGTAFGTAQVLIDGASKGTFNQYASSTHYKVPRTFKSLSSASHTITIKVLGQKGSSSGTDTLVAVDAFKVGSGSVVSSPKLTHTWRRAGSSSASGGAYAMSDRKGSDVSLTFRGTGIDWYTIVGSNQGQVNVFIDDKLVATVDNYSSTTKFGVRRSIRNLSNALHTLRIQVAGTKNTSSSGTAFRLDRWVVV